VLPRRLVVFLRYYADLDYSTIAEVLTISSGTVGATLTSARAALARALEVKEATP
jgi:DNA-directed RNA polymerase specialized sigma24 family protein